MAGLRCVRWPAIPCELPDAGGLVGTNFSDYVKAVERQNTPEQQERLDAFRALYRHKRARAEPGADSETQAR